MSVIICHQIWDQKSGHGLSVILRIACGRHLLVLFYRFSLCVLYFTLLLSLHVLCAFWHNEYRVNEEIKNNLFKFCK